MTYRYSVSIKMAALSLALLVTACGGGGGTTATPAVTPEDPRPQDARIFTADATVTTFNAMAAAPSDVVAMSSTSRWAGVLGGAGYRVEVPPSWNGKLVMYAHGYAGTGSALGVTNPSIRRYLIQNGYAWAASSYSKNYYDVRAGVEDTNALANAFTTIAANNSRPLAAPTRIYIIGHSMGGHITGAAIEDETYATAINKVRYHGAVPMCGVMGDTDLGNYFAAMQIGAQTLTGYPNHPFNKWSEIQDLVTGALFPTFAPATVTTTALGNKYALVLQNLSGGPRPMFNFGLSFGGSISAPWSFFGSDGTFSGILNGSVADTRDVVYTIDGDTAGSAALNAAAPKLTPVADANRLRRDGLRWIPKVNGEFRIPVVSIHTLGDLFVPFSMQQIYQRRVAAKGNSDWLVQRAIRGASHCDFTIAEQVAAFEDMIKWERDGVKPSGDNVVTPATVAASTYGCTYTRNNLGPDESGTTNALRPTLAFLAPCP